MTTQQLKNSILQMAVQGKLVPQDPNDEPASVLLERIKAEKEALIKSGKIKKSKKSSEIFRGASRTLPYTFCEQIGKEIRDISDEIPFEISESWEWVRLGIISTYNQTKKKINAKDADISIWGLDLEDIEKGGRLLVKKTVGERNAIGDKTVFEKGDILYSKLRPYLLKILVAPDGGICTPEIVPFTVYGGISAEYIVNFLKSPYVDGIVNGETYGMKMPRVGTDTIISLLTPLPPLAEQKRIVAKIEELLPYIEKYEQAETKLTALNKSFLEMLKKSILQEAVQGKLVPQNPDDEPASILLERIRAEKQELIRQGKIKKSKHESIIVTRDKIPYEIIDGKERCIADEVPFEIPESWEWARIFSIGAIIRGSGIKRTETINKGKPCIRYGELYTTYNIQFSNTVSFVSDNLFEKCKKITTGDLLFTLTGENKPDIAKTITYIGEKEVAIGGDLAYWTCHGMNSLYLTYFMCSPYAVNCKIKLATGNIIVHISGEKIGSILMPVPPLPEQKRIVEKIEELMTFCEKLK